MPVPAVIRLTAPGSITLHGAEAVAMLDRAVEQIGDGGEVDVRVRPDVHALARRQPRRAELVDEDERPDHRPLACGQRPVDLEIAKIVGDRRDGHRDYGVPCAGRERFSARVRKSGNTLQANAEA